MNKTKPSTTKMRQSFLKQLFLIQAVLSTVILIGCGTGGSSSNIPVTPVTPVTATPIKHLVVIFQENVSFDHYFGTYPVAANLPGESIFTAAPNTPVANNLLTPLDVQNNFVPLVGVNLLINNPTIHNATNGTNAINPFRLPPSQAFTADQDHSYSSEQLAFNNGAMDLFPATVGNGDIQPGFPPPLNTPGLVMGYFDGNTVTALWNYAQHFAINDNSFNTTFGPSNVGAINLVSGQTNGVIATNVAAVQSGTNLDHVLTNDGNGGITITGDPQPLGDACMTRGAVQLSGKNIGDLLNAAGISWGFFQGGFDLTLTNSNGTTGCSRSTASSTTNVTSLDYVPHHQPFQYYTSTANLQHLRPSSIAAIGHTLQADGTTKDPANHQYDIHDFFDAVSAGNFPAVSFLKAPAFQDGHAGYSSPLDEQNFITTTINFLQQQPDWNSTLVVIAYDDSDGWYDHQMSPIVNPSNTLAGPFISASANFMINGLLVLGNGDFLNGAGACSSGMNQGRPAPTVALAGANGQPNAQGRCGYGPRLPFLVISPYAKQNYVDHTLTDQTSIIRFIEDNWLGGQRIVGSFDTLAGPLTNMLDFTKPARKDVLMLDPMTGQPK